MKKCLLISILSLVLAITWGGEAFPQSQKEMTFSGTHYWASTPKTFKLDQDRQIGQLEIFGVRVNDNSDDPFHGVSTHIFMIFYRSKEYQGSSGYETWTDKDGDKVTWELLHTPAGSSSMPARLIEGTGKYLGWQGTMEITVQFPKSFPEGTLRGIGRQVIKIVAPQ